MRFSTKILAATAIAIASAETAMVVYSCSSLVGATCRSWRREVSRSGINAATRRRRQPLSNVLGGVSRDSKTQSSTSISSLLHLRGGSGGGGSDDDASALSLLFVSRNPVETDEYFRMSITPENSLPIALLVQGGGDANTTNTAVITTDMALTSVQWSSYRNRVATAIGMMSFLAFLSYYFQEDGLTVFTVLLQGMLFQEMTTVIGGEFPNPLSKWWWFVASIVAWNGPKLYPWKSTLLQSISYSMTVMSVMGATLRLNWQNNGKLTAFREYIRQAAVVALSSVLVVWPASYWIATLEEFGMVWILVPAIYMTINDTTAYIAGRAIGKHALLPFISPRKTWEGFLVAALFTVSVAFYFGSNSGRNLVDRMIKLKQWYPLDKMDGLVLAGFVSLVAPFGGFLASIIKRAYGQKHFGTILPGHGGFVDRLDCQLLLAPAVYFYLSLYKFAAVKQATGTSI